MEEGEKCVKLVKTEAIVTYDSHCLGNQCNLSSDVNTGQQKQTHYHTHSHHHKQKKHL